MYDPGTPADNSVKITYCLQMIDRKDKGENGLLPSLLEVISEGFSKEADNIIYYRFKILIFGQPEHYIRKRFENFKLLHAELERVIEITTPGEHLRTGVHPSLHILPELPSEDLKKVFST